MFSNTLQDSKLKLRPDLTRGLNQMIPTSPLQPKSFYGSVITHMKCHVRDNLLSFPKDVHEACWVSSILCALNNGKKKKGVDSVKMHSISRGNTVCRLE